VWEVQLSQDCWLPLSAAHCAAAAALPLTAQYTFVVQWPQAGPMAVSLDRANGWLSLSHMGRRLALRASTGRPAPVVPAGLESAFFYLSMKGFAPGDIMDGLAACGRDPLKAREWLEELRATRQFNLDLNHALDLSREQHDSELVRQTKMRDDARRAVTPLANPEFAASGLLAAIRAASPLPAFAKWTAAGAGKDLITVCLDHERRSAQWYPCSEHYFRAAAAALVAAARVSAFSQSLAAEVTRINTGALV
jgi:hypothetical protein